MVLFTVLQAFGLALLWVVKSFKQIALAFPFFVILMIPYRYLLKFIFTEKELSAVRPIICNNLPENEINHNFVSWTEPKLGPISLV